MLFRSKSDKFGLGFTTGAQRAVRRARAGGPPLRINNHGINAIEESEEESDIDSWIYPTTNGGPSNWTTRDFIPVSFIPQCCTPKFSLPFFMEKHNPRVSQIFKIGSGIDQTDFLL